jgi:serine/threonine-protein kinase
VIGQTVSHYKIIEKLGEGGMGIVYKAQDTKLNRFVALKFLPFHVNTSSEEIDRFQREAMAISALNHPNIATIHDLDEANQKKFLVLEYIPGGTLKQKIQNLSSSGQELSLGLLVDYGIQIAEGLAHAHKHGIIHRDIKSDNMMLTEEGKVKITDFGIAMIHGSMEHTEDGSTLGTAAYMSPEQIFGVEQDYRSDLFSFGIILYELASGKFPFRGEHQAALGYSIVNEDPIPLESVRPGIPRTIQNVIYRCLEKDKIKRYQKAEEIVNELREFQQESSTDQTIPRVKATVGTAGKSIAVLPFVNMSPDRENEYFSDGMTEEILNALGKIEGLRVASRTSSFAFKGKEQDIRKIGEQLNVNIILEGSVRKSGNKLRITAQLINVEEGYHIWSEKYDRKLEDIFEIQDEITRAIVDMLKIKLMLDPAATLNKRYTDNLEAYTLYLKGRYFCNLRTTDGLNQGIQYFEQAIDKDPKYAKAHGGLADAYLLLGIYGEIPPNESMPKAKAAAMKALEMDATLAEPHTSLGCIRAVYDWDFPGAEIEFKRSIELDPGYPTSHHWYAINCLAPLGRMEEAITELEIAQKLDPLSLIINASLGLQFYYARRFDEAIEQFRITLEMDPNFAMAHFFLAETYIQRKSFPEAIAAIQKAISLYGGSVNMSAMLGYVFARSGRKEEAQKKLDNLNDRSNQQYVSAYDRAVVCTGLGNNDQAFEWLEKAFQERSYLLVYLKVDPVLDSLRTDPRFDAILKKMGT